MDTQIWRATEAEFRRRFVEASQKFHDADATLIISQTDYRTEFDVESLNKRAEAAHEMSEILKDWNIAGFKQSQEMSRTNDA